MAEKKCVTPAALTLCQLYHRMLALRSRHSAWDGNGVRRMTHGLASFLATPLRVVRSKSTARSSRTIFLEFAIPPSHARSVRDAGWRWIDAAFRWIAPAWCVSGYPAELLADRTKLQGAIVYSLPIVHGLNHFDTRTAHRSARHQRLARAFHNRQAQTSRLGEKTFTRHHPHPLQLSPCLSDSA